MISSTLTRSDKRRERVERKRTSLVSTKHKRKKSYRIKAHTYKGRLVFTKIKSSQPLTSVRRVATNRGLVVDRVR